MSGHWTQDVHEQLHKIKDLPDATRDDIMRLCGIVEALPDYNYRRKEFIEFEEAVDACEDLDTLSELMQAVAELCGFKHASIFLLRTGEAITFKTRVCTSFPIKWLDRYDSKSYQFMDPVFKYAFIAEEPFQFVDLPPQPPFVESFWRDAVETGIGRQGCCFTYDFGMNIRIGVSFTATSSQTETTENYLKHRNDLEILGKRASETFIEQAGVFRVATDELTINELRYLKRLINASEDAAASAIVQEEKSAHLRRSICRRLGVTSMFQALSVVSKQDWFDDLPFEGPEVAKPYPEALERPPEQTAPALMKLILEGCDEGGQ